MDESSLGQRVTLASLATPAKALVTCVIVTLAFGMAGALGQIWVHDIVPTFLVNEEAGQATEAAPMTGMKDHAESAPASSRGDLFAELTVSEAKPQQKSLYQNEQFVWTLKWSHIHLFGMNMIFILLGGVTLLLDVCTRLRTWLIVLPFAGVLVDILAMWLKGFVSPVFFWLHVPGGGVFAVVFGYVAIRALWEMWATPDSRQISSKVKSSV